MMFPCHVIYYLAITLLVVVLLSSSSAHGFSFGGGGGQLFICCTSHHHHAQRQQLHQLFLSSVVTPPEIDIDTSTLLYQAYTALTIREVKDILRQYGAKITGNKSELIDRLGEILNNDKRQGGHTKEEGQHPATSSANVKQKTLKEYNEMTLNELREILRVRGLNSEGNKRELVHRVLIQGYEAKSQLLAVVRRGDHNNSDHAELDDNREWQVLEPSIIQLCEDLSSDDQEEIVLADGNELPFLSGLLFVNKPSGWSTLPTKQQLDNPTCPKYPCLSDSVIEWLKTDPKGKERLRKAQLDEQHWWDSVILQMEPRNSKQRRQLKKRIRQQEKQLEKMSLFEPRPAHRLDIDTSGIVCICLTPTALRNANLLFERKSRSGIDKEVLDISDNTEQEEEGCVEKRYVALVEGSMDKESSAGVISQAIGKVWVDDHNEWACDVHDDGSFAFIRHNGSSDTTLFVPNSLREAITSYKAVDWGTVQSKSVTRVELTPFTGRGHQLRLHMVSMQHPIVGDYMHGDKRTIDKQVKLCLHASKLSMNSLCFGSSDGGNDSLQKCRIVIESAPPF